MNAQRRPELLGAARASAGRQDPTVPRHGWDAETERWRARAIASLERLAASGQDFTATDVTLSVGSPCPAPTLLGGLLARAHGRGLVVLVGATVDTRPSGKVATTRVWRGATPAPEAAP